ncbi:MAG: hypothetical protein IPL61_22800 [Myxococcales bacterium]|nr:hypothetical protein [Myxococcales bacterium]
MKLPHLVSFALLLTAAACGKAKDQDMAPSAGTKPIEPAGGTATAPAGGTATAPAGGTATAPAGGPGTTAATTATPEQTALLVDLGSVQIAVCACPDRACVEKEIAAGAPFDRRLDTMYEHEATLPVAVKTEVDAIQQRIEACTTRIGGANPPLTAATTRVLGQFDALATETCACTDRACADAAKKRWDVLETTLKATSKPSGDIPEGVVSRMVTAQGRAQACVDKLPS